MATRNDITGDALISKVNTDKFRDNFDRIFRKGKSDDKGISAAVLEPTSASQTDEICGAYESSNDVVEVAK